MRSGKKERTMTTKTEREAAVEALVDRFEIIAFVKDAFDVTPDDALDDTGQEFRGFIYMLFEHLCCELANMFPEHAGPDAILNEFLTEDDFQEAKRKVIDKHLTLDDMNWMIEMLDISWELLPSPFGDGWVTIKNKLAGKEDGGLVFSSSGNFHFISPPTTLVPPKVEWPNDDDEEGKRVLSAWVEEMEGC